MNKRIILFSTAPTYCHPASEKLQSRGYYVTHVSEKSSGEGLQDRITAANPIAGVVLCYGNIISREIISLFPKGIINIHPSLLPKYRGPSPVASAILNGETVTGVTIFKIDEKIDHGPILIQKEHPISPNETRQNLLEKLFSLGSELLVDILPHFITDKLKPTPQDHSKATYTKLLTKEDGHIDWGQPDDYIERQIRAYQPWPGTWALVNKKRVLIKSGHLDATGDLIINRIQVAGKTPVEGAWTRRQLFAYIS